MKTALLVTIGLLGIVGGLASLFFPDHVVRKRKEYGKLNYVDPAGWFYLGKGGKWSTRLTGALAICIGSIALLASLG